MINSVKQAIANKLLDVYPAGYTVYDEEIPQNYNRPSFLIQLLEQDYSKRLNSKYKSLMTFDVTYFSNSEVTELRADCQKVMIDLSRAFDLIETYRVHNLKTRITDNILHITFAIRVSEIKTENAILMQQQETNTNI